MHIRCQVPPPRVIATLLVVVLLALAAGPARALQPNPMRIGMKPVLGWSSWSFRGNASAAKDEAEARAMVSSGLAQLGYRYINQGWYECPGGLGSTRGSPPRRGAPTVDKWGFWIPKARFTAQGSTNGIKALADYVHSLGLKFGIYLTPGISLDAVTKNTPVEASVAGRLTGRPGGYTAAQIATHTPEQNYDCGGSGASAGGMVGLDFSSPGAQLFVNSFADTLASWGVDFLKLDAIRYPADVAEDLALLKNREVLAVDQDGIAARRLRNAPTEQIFAKREPGGEVIVGLFNTGTTDSQKISIAPSAIGLPAGCTAYTLEDLWSHRSSRRSGQLTAAVPPEGVALFRVTHCH